MKKKLIDAIKAKFVGIDESTAKRLAERAISKSENGISTDDEVTSAVDAITLTDVLKSASDFSADEAVKRYEEKYGLENGEKKAKPDDKKDDAEIDKNKKDKDKDDDKNTPDPADAFKALLAELKESMTKDLNAIKDDLTAMKSGKLTESRKAKLEAVIKDLKDSQKKPYGRIDLGKMSDDEFDAFITEVKEDVGDLIADNRASGSHVSPLFGGKNRQTGGGNGNTGGNDTKEATKEEIDALMGKFGLQ